LTLLAFEKASFASDILNIEVVLLRYLSQKNSDFFPWNEWSKSSKIVVDYKLTCIICSNVLHKIESYYKL